ncbi:allophanate hydrolase [bacterium]|nr:allophanate hydrolase [bacterium]
MTIESLRAEYDGGRSPLDVVDETFARIAASADPAAWIALRDAHAVRREAAALRDADRGRLPLWGVPFAVKDNIDVAGIDTTAACPPFAYRPRADATAVARLRAAGALVIGKTNLDQFATGLVGVRSPYGIPRCVFDPAYVSGGSSSGSAVAVARGEVAFALGTDTAGSGRVPAAFNHVVGVKPTRGLIGAGGVVPACQSLDVVSVVAASCGEADLVRRAAQGADPRDPYSRSAPARPLPRCGLRVGVLAARDRDFEGDAAAAAQYDRAVAGAAARWETRKIDYAPFRETAALLYDGPWLAERWLALADALARHGEAVDATVRALVEPAARLTAADAFRGLHRRAALAARAAAVWEAVDVLLLPTAPTQPRVDAVLADPIRRNAPLGRYTNFVNLLDYCAVAVPAGFRPDGLPFGVTLIAPAFADDDLAAIADQLHRALEPTWGLARAPLPEGLPAACRGGGVRLAVVGAHLTGLPLNHQLVERGAALVARTRTAGGYRLYALPGSAPPKPGLVRDAAASGPGIEVEVWELSIPAFGAFVAEVPPPLAIGTVVLADGDRVKGFVCEPAAVVGAEEITRFGGWRAYLAAR